MRIGVFGGSFDPVHLGHLIVAEQCREAAALDHVLFVPAPRPPHKSESDLTPFHLRVEMLALALAGQSAFAIDEIERDRSGPSYTADTLQILRDRQPDADWHLILGADSLEDFPNWHRPDRIVELANLVVASRPDQPEDAAKRFEARLAHVSVHLQVVRVPLIGISSTDVRCRVASGQSKRFLVPRAVEGFINDRQLNRE